MKRGELSPFTCPTCGQTLELPFAANRKRCPRCSYKHGKELAREQDRERKEQYKKDARAREKQAKEAARKAAAAKAAAQAAAHDAEIDAGSKKEIRLLCHRCVYRMYDPNKEKTIGCNYLLWKGHSRDKGNGPGDCRSFVPLTSKTKQERAEHIRRAMALSEADRAH